MKRNKSLVYFAPILLTLAACSGGAKSAMEQSPTSSPAAAPKIGVIQEPDFLGCQAALQLPEDYKRRNGKYVFKGNLGDVGQMNIDGHDLYLSLTESDEPNRTLKAGEQFSQTYTGEELNVRIDYVITRSGDLNHNRFDATYYSATIVVDSNGVRRRIETSGWGGCPQLPATFRPVARR